MSGPQQHDFVFIGGLHRSGTSLVHSVLRGHPMTSGFHDTGVPQDEGQHLQSVFPTAQAYGGPGRFGFNPEAHLTEASPLASATSAERLFSEWSSYWDLSRALLLEKSPPNLIRTRFLQALFPRSRFIIMVRHPLVVSLATRKWARSESLGSLLDHWFQCHAIFLKDLPSVRAVRVVNYEDLCGATSRVTSEVASFLGIEGGLDASRVDSAANARYLEEWARLRRRFPQRLHADRLIRQFEEDANRFGYSLDDLDAFEPMDLPS